MAEPLYVAFTGHLRGLPAVGWVVIEEVTPVTKGADIEMLCRTIEEKRGYDVDTVVITNFQRLERS
jgi:hypothetical protein